MAWFVEWVSNERLEQEIAAFYLEGARLLPGRSVSGSLLESLWLEFDRRVELGVIVVE